MKILIISYSYTPDLTPRAFRWAALAAQLAQLGHEVHVLCAARQSNGTQAPSDGVEVHRVRDWLLNASARVTPTDPLVPVKTSSGILASARAFIRKGVRSLWRFTHWPDYACGWVLPATKAARNLCDQHRFDWVISVSHPFTGHVVGWLCRANHRGARWLVDIGDPFHLMKEPSPNNMKLYGGLNRWVEGRIVASADAISVTTESTRDMYIRYFNVPAAKVQVMPPLLTLPQRAAATVSGKGDGLRLVFVGTLYRKLRSPRYMLACFEALIDRLPAHKLELHIYGAINDCADEIAQCPEVAKRSLTVHGMVDRSEVHKAMLDADILINIGNESTSQLASKVIEYIAVAKPILNLVSIENDTSVQALAAYPAVLTVMRSEAPPARSDISRIFEFIFNPPSVRGEDVEKILYPYSAANVAKLYAERLTQETARHDTTDA